MATITLQPAGVTVTIEGLTADDLGQITRCLAESHADDRLYRLFDKAADTAHKMMANGRSEIVEIADET